MSSVVNPCRITGNPQPLLARFPALSITHCRPRSASPPGVDWSQTMRYIIALLAVAGIAVSALAFQVHYSNAVEPCDINSHWDCGIVNHSSFSTVTGLWWHLREAHNPSMEGTPPPRTGLPVAAVGMAGYLAIAILAFFRRRWWVILFTLFGLAFALYLSNIEAHVLEVWCLYCVISQFLIATLALLSVIWLFFRPRPA